MIFKLNNSSKTLEYTDKSGNYIEVIDGDVTIIMSNAWGYYHENKEFGNRLKISNDRFEYESNKGNCEDAPTAFKKDCEVRLKEYLNLKRKYVKTLLKLLEI